MNKLIFTAIFGFYGCQTATEEVVQALTGGQVEYSIIEYGATPDDGVDDRAAIQLALNAAGQGGGVVHVPAGVFDVYQPDITTRLNVPDGVTVAGDSSEAAIIRQAAGAAAAARVFYAGNNVTFRSFAVHGNAANQTPNEQRHGFFILGANVTFDAVTASGFTGDGIYLYIGSRSVTLTDVTATFNNRNGLTMGSDVRDVTVTGGRFENNAVQQIDLEPGPGHAISGVKIRGASLGSQADYALTLSGSGSAQRSSDLEVRDCDIAGAVFIVWVSDVRFVNNRVAVRQNRSGVTIYRESTDVLVAGNTIDHTEPSTTLGTAAVAVLGTGAGNTPDRVNIVSNRITTSSAMAVRAAGVNQVAVVNNRLTGALVAGVPAVQARATLQNDEFYYFTLVDNIVLGFTRGLLLSGNAGAKLYSAFVLRNTLDGISLPVTQDSSSVVLQIVR